MSKVTIKIEKIVIPTYDIFEYDKNPMFIEKRVYQGSSGRVYPHPVCYGISDTKKDKEYTGIILENDYILVLFLPEIGGRVQRLYDKTNGYDAVYYNEVIKPALVGLAGPWISGGIEFNWPQHHRPSTFDPLNYTYKENNDGSVSVYIGEIDKMFHLKSTTCFTIYPDKAYLEIKGYIYNPNEIPNTFLWWANPAVSVNDYTQSIFPPDVNAVMDHGKRDVSEFPIAKGVYYKYNYAPGTDISRYKNIPVPTSYMAYHSDFDFIGNYDYSKSSGLLHIADHHISPGKKQWTWGNGDFGRAWDRNLTDNNGPYIEIMTGVFTDNQPDFTYIKPYEEKTFVQYFMPYKEVGKVSNASEKAIMNVTFENKTIFVTIYAPQEIKNANLILTYHGKKVGTRKFNLQTSHVYKTKFNVDGNFDNYVCELRADDNIYLICKKVENNNEMPSPAQVIPEPKYIDTNEKLFLCATHLEQYRHATYSSEPYYLEGLKRDPSDVRINNGYGKYLYNKGLFFESINYFNQAIKSSTWKNPNPYDCEPYYNLGLALEKIGDYKGAYDAFYKATWDCNLQGKAFYKLGCLSLRINGTRGLDDALNFVNKSLIYMSHNEKARLLKTIMLRKSDKINEACEYAKQTLEIDMLSYSSYYELYKMGKYDLSKVYSIFGDDNHNYIELALCYIEFGLLEEAFDVLSLSKCTDDPMLNYYKYYLTKKRTYLSLAEKGNSNYCFPNRLDDISILKFAIDNGGVFAKYYLGCLYYDKGQWDKAIKLWEECKDTIGIPTAYRNLSIALYNKEKNAKKALEYMKKAFSMDVCDARVFFELDLLYKLTNRNPKVRLQNMQKHKDLLDKRDDLYIEYITLLNLMGRHSEALKTIENHIFHPFEGGEGKITSQYKAALIGLSKNASKEDTIELLKKALVYPENLGEGKLIGTKDNDIHYLLACLYTDKKLVKEELNLATLGDFGLNAAMYYNDNPPDMMYYMCKAMEKLGKKNEAKKRFESFIQYADNHMKYKIKIDYFAVSIPDFSVFDNDLDKNNKVHCLYLKSLGYLGLGDLEKAREYAKEGLKLQKCHMGLNSILNL